MPKKKPSDEMVRFRCQAAEKEAFQSAAERDGFQTLSAWILHALRQKEKESRRQKD